MRISILKPYFLLLMIALYFLGCKAYMKLYYKITNVTFNNCDNTGKRPHDTDRDSIAAAAYAIRMEFKGIVYLSDNGKDVQGENLYYLGHKLVDFNIYSNTGFDAAHPPGTPLVDRFYYMKDTIGYDPGPIGSYYLMDFVKFDSWKAHSDPVTASSYLLLMYPPDTLGPRTFTVNYVFDDSSKFSGTLNVNLR